MKILLVVVGIVLLVGLMFGGKFVSVRNDLATQELEQAQNLDATVANMRFVKPLDVDLVVELARTHDAIVTVEEGCTMGGAGSAVIEADPSILHSRSPL